jgi:dolichol-phosphate mannosyltransferase
MGINDTSSISESVAICMPVRNEVEVIEKVVLEWLSVASKVSVESKVILEDGGSTDGTVEILKKLLINHRNLEVIFQEKADGFGNSARRLLRKPNTEWIFFTDSDGQYVPNEFWLLWNRRSGLDFVRGIKLGRQDPLLRRITSLAWNKSVNFLFELPVHDVNTAFILVRKSFLDKIIDSIRILPTMVISEMLIRLVLANANFSRDLYVLHRARSSGPSRATPIYSLFKVGIVNVVGLFKMKSDYRTSF